jgi:hypothetical protein
VLKQLIVVDYQEGAGGEFLASWLSAHFGQQLVTNPQSNPNYLQKWLNSHSLVKSDWREKFIDYLLMFNSKCMEHGIQNIAVPYHLYKYPEHVQILEKINQARFVRIDCTGHELQINKDFQRKVLNRILDSNDFGEIKFILTNKSQDRIRHCLDLYKAKQLTYGKLLSIDNVPVVSRTMPSKDIQILYQDFFVEFDKTPDAYRQLCLQLNLEYNNSLLDCLIQRNKKNLQELQNM